MSIYRLIFNSPSIKSMNCKRKSEGGEGMNKKIGFIAIILLALPILSAIPVQAGKGQDKLSFELQIAGVPDNNQENFKRWEPGINVQVRGRNFFITHPEDTFVLIDEGGPNEALIEGDRINYYAEMYTKNHPEKGFYVIQVREVVSIYETNAKENLMGTLEIVALGKTKGDHGPATSFVGHGTGGLKGVKVSGNSEPATVTMPPPVLIVQLNRVGTVMGWPTT